MNSSESRSLVKSSDLQDLGASGSQSWSLGNFQVLESQRHGASDSQHFGILGVSESGNLAVFVGFSESQSLNLGLSLGFLESRSLGLLEFRRFKNKSLWIS